MKSVEHQTNSDREKSLAISIVNSSMESEIEIKQQVMMTAVVLMMAAVICAYIGAVVALPCMGLFYHAICMPDE